MAEAGRITIKRSIDAWQPGGSYFGTGVVRLGIAGQSRKGYRASVKPVINLGDAVGKIVGKRTPPADSLEYGFRLQKTLNDLGAKHRTSKEWRGVFRFRSHKEADEWLMRRHLQKKAN